MRTLWGGLEQGFVERLIPNVMKILEKKSHSIEDLLILLFASSPKSDCQNTNNVI